MHSEKNVLHSIIMILYIFVHSFIFLLCLGPLTYSGQRKTMIPNFVAILLGLVIILFTIILFSKTKFQNIKIGIPFNIKSCTGTLFVIQSYIWYNIYFVSQEWDAWIVINNSKKLSEKGILDNWANWYFSVNPNNRFLLLLYSWLFKFNKLFGVFDTDNGLMMMILIQAGLSALCGLLLYYIILDLTESKICARIGYFIYVVLIGFSGWNVVIYSDMTALFFPSLIFRIYQKEKNYKRWILISVLTYWGYKIKPTVAIVFISIIIVELIGNDKLRFNLKSFFKFSKYKYLIVIIACFIVSICVYNRLINTSGLMIDEELNTGVSHYIMMGLNSETDGRWYRDDKLMSYAIEEKAKRTKAETEVVFKRIKEFGPLGLMLHIMKKTKVNYNDGSFAWGQEGGFFDLIYDDKNELMAPFLKSIFYTFGENYKYLFVVEHTTWLTVLFFAIGAGIFSNKNSKDQMILIISVIGIFLFTLLFEARARYLLLYVPFYIICASITIDYLIKRYITNLNISIDFVV